MGLLCTGSPLRGLRACARSEVYPYYSSRDRDDRYGRLSVGRRASAIDDKPVTERAEPLMTARMTKTSSM